MPPVPKLRFPLLRATGARPAQFVALAVLSVIGGFAEAAALVLIVQIAFRLAGGASGSEDVAFLATGHWSLSTLFLCTVSVSFVRLVALGWAAWIGAAISAKVMLNARNELFSAFADASWDVQSADEEGHLQDLTTTQMVYASGYALIFAGVLTSGVNFLTLLVSALVVSPLAAATMVGVAVLLFVALRRVSRAVKQLSEAQAAGTTQYGRGISQAVSLALEGRVFNVTREFDRRLRDTAERVAAIFFRAQLLGKLVPTLYQSIALLLIVAVLWILHHFALGAIAGVGAVVILLVRSLSYGQLLQSNYNDLQFYLPYAEGVERAIEHYRRNRMTGGRKTVSSIDRLRFNGVSFSYDGRTPALDDVSFEVARGEIVGIAGPSGAGKSTLVELLLRLRRPTRGDYLINGVSTEEFDLESWFSRLAIVRQEARLVTGSVADNVRFLRGGISDSAVAEAARLGHLHELMLEGNGGYGRLVGERGSALSGGQRQRLTIARAIVGKPDLVVLDEPTSALDMHAESVIHETLRRLRGRAIVFVVGHRPSTLRICDRIMVLERGHLKAFDTPSVLTTTSDYFRRALELSRLD